MQAPNSDNPLIVHADRTVALETFSPLAEEARSAIAPFAELEKAPEYLHTYRITPLSIWNAASAGWDGDEMLAALGRYTKFPLPANVQVDIRELAGRWGRLRLVPDDGGDLLLQVGAGDEALLLELKRHDRLEPLLNGPHDELAVKVRIAHRGRVKQVLLSLGWPVQDLAGYEEGQPVPIELAASVDVRPYQLAAAEAFFQGGESEGGSGVVVLPPGSGKTIVGLAAMALVGQKTLVLTTSRTSVNQWRRELLAKTSVTADRIAEYGPRGKNVADITLCTYQMLVSRARAGRGGPSASTGEVHPTSADLAGPADPAETTLAEYPHMDLLREHGWGMVIYDEVHLLPANVFRMTAEIQARRRLGLTATLVREDGREADVFSLIGPKRFDTAWRMLERQGWIAEASCCEVRLAFNTEDRMAYALADVRARFRLASENRGKLPLVRELLKRHEGQPALVIGQYLDQLERMAVDLGAPLITGATPQTRREELFDAFRAGTCPVLVLSKVGNFALDLPDAAVMVQVSGAFGSRQEEAQRLGRLLRPKANGAPVHFYTLITRETEEESFAQNRQRFLTEQGYSYRILDEADIQNPTALPVELLN